MGNGGIRVFDSDHGEAVAESIQTLSSTTSATAAVNSSQQQQQQPQQKQLKNQFPFALYAFGSNNNGQVRTL